MRTLYLVAISYIGIILTSCATTSEPTVKPATVKKAKNPTTVALYPNSKDFKQPFTILGKETVSKFNKGGNKRQEASIHESMRQIAALLGGDAVINITRDDKFVNGTVIAFQDADQPNKAG